MKDAYSQQVINNRFKTKNKTKNAQTTLIIFFLD